MMSMTWWMWLLLLLGGWAILLLVHFLGGKVIERLASPEHFLRLFSERIRWPSRLFFLAAFLRVCIPLAPIPAKWQSYLIVGDMIVLIICTTWMLMSAVEALFQLVVMRHPLNVSDNLRSRQIYTQARVLARSVHFLLVLLGLSFALMVLPGARQLGTSLLASAGVAGLVAGIAARPVLGNFIAGLQIAFTQPIRIDDVVIVEGEWGRIEEITSTYVVVRVWDARRLIVPLQWFVETVFQNWTRRSASLLGTVFLWVDYKVEMQGLNAAFKHLCESSELWDRRVQVLQVTDTNEWGMQLRFLVSAADSGRLFDLRCLLRERLVAYLSQHQPDAFVRVRMLEAQPEGHGPDSSPS